MDWAYFEMSRSGCQVAWKIAGTSLPRSIKELVKAGTTEMREV